MIKSSVATRCRANLNDYAINFPGQKNRSRNCIDQILVSASTQQIIRHAVNRSERDVMGKKKTACVSESALTSQRPENEIKNKR